MTAVTMAPVGEQILDPSNPDKVLFLLKRGHVQIYRLNGEGKKPIDHEVQPGGFFDEMPLLGQGLLGGFAIANEDSLTSASREDVLELFRTQPEIAE